MELKDKFWKFASTSNKVANLESIFIEWAAKERLTIEEFNRVYASVNDQVSDMLKTSGFSIKQNGQTLEFDTMEDYNAFMANNQQAQQPQVQDNSVAEPPVEEPAEIAQPEPEIGNDVGQDQTSNPTQDDMGLEQNKSAISPEPNAAISDTPEQGGDVKDKEKNELREGLLGILKK